jgi:hypothetical protein
LVYLSILGIRMIRQMIRHKYGLHWAVSRGGCNSKVSTIFLNGGRDNTRAALLALRGVGVKEAKRRVELVAEKIVKARK